MKNYFFFSIMCLILGSCTPKFTGDLSKVKPSETKVVLEVNGQQTIGTPLSKEEFELVKAELAKDGKDASECCGYDWCSPDGYWWVCSLNRNNECQWFSTDWRCN